MCVRVQGDISRNSPLAFKCGHDCICSYRNNRILFFCYEYATSTHASGANKVRLPVCVGNSLTPGVAPSQQLIKNDLVVFRVLFGCWAVRHCGSFYSAPTCK